MSTETNAAATLVVDINTKPALDNLQALEQKYAALQAAFGKSNEGAVVSQKQLDDVKRLTKEIGELKSTIESLKQKAKEGGEQVGNMFQAGLQSGAGSFKLSKLVLPEDQQKLIAKNFGKLGLEGAQALVDGFTNANFAKQKQALLYFEQNTEKSLKKIQGMMRAAQDVASTFGSDTARAKFGDLFLDPNFKSKVDQQLSLVRHLQDEAAKAAQAQAKARSEAEIGQKRDLELWRKQNEALREQATIRERLSQRSISMNQRNAQWDRLNETVYYGGTKEQIAALERQLKLVTEIQDKLKAGQSLRTVTQQYGTAAVSDYTRGVGYSPSELKSFIEHIRKVEADRIQAKKDADRVLEQADRAYLAEAKARLKQHYAEVKADSARSAAERQMHLDQLAKSQARQQRVEANNLKNSNWSYDYGGDLKKQLQNQLKIAQEVEKAIQAQLSSRSIVEKFGSSAFTSVNSGATSVATLRTQLDALNQTNTRTTGTTRSLTQANQAARDAAREHREQQAMLHSTLRGVAGGLDNLWLTYGRFIPQMVSAYAAVSAFRKAATEGIQFDYQTQFISALGGDRALSAQNIQDQLLSIQGSPANVNELATSLRVLQQTGIDAAEGMGLLKTVISASTLGETSLKVAAEDIVGVLEVFNLHSEDPLQLASNFRKAGDVLAYVAQETKANLHDVAAGMQAATGISSQYNISLEKVAATAAVLGKQGIVGSKSGTFIRNFVEELYQPRSDKSRKALAELGVNAYDDKGQAKEYVSLIKELIDKLKEYKSVARDSFVAAIFGERGKKPFRGIMQDFDGFLEKIREAEAANGLLEKQTSKLAETTQYQLQQLKADYDNLFIKTWSDDSLAAPIQALRDAIGSADLQQLFRSVVQSLVEFGTTLALNIDQVLLFGKAVASWLAFQTVHGTVAVLTTTIGSLAPVVGLATTALAGGSVAMQTFGAVAMGTATTMAGRTGLLAALSTVAPAAAGVIGALGPIAVVLGTVGAAWYIFRDRTAEAMESAADAAAKGADRILASLARITNEIHDVPVAVSAAAVRNEKTSAKLMGETNEQNLKQLQRQYPELRGKSDEDLRTYLKGYVYEGWDGVVQNHGGAAPQAVEAYLKGVSSYQRTLGEISAAEAAVEMKKREAAQSDYDRLMQGAVGVGVKDRAPKPDKGGRSSKAAANEAYRAEIAEYEGALRSIAESEREQLSELETQRNLELVSFGEFYDRKLAIMDKATQDRIDFVTKERDAAQASGNLPAVKQYQAELDVLAAKLLKGNDSAVTKLKTDEIQRATLAWKKLNAEMALDTKKVGDESRYELALRTASAEERVTLEIEKQVTAYRDSKIAAMGNFDKKDTAEYKAQLALVTQGVEDYRQALIKAAQDKKVWEADWTNGAQQAWQSWVDSANNAASIAERSFSTVFKKIDDVMLDFVRTGKLNFKSLGQTIKDEVIKLLYELTVKKFVISLVGDFSGLALGALAALGGSKGSSSSSFSMDGITSSTGNPLQDATKNSVTGQAGVSAASYLGDLYKPGLGTGFRLGVNQAGEAAAAYYAGAESIAYGAGYGAGLTATQAGNAATAFSNAAAAAERSGDITAAMDYARHADRLNTISQNMAAGDNLVQGANISSTVGQALGALAAGYSAYTLGQRYGERYGTLGGAGASLLQVGGGIALTGAITGGLAGAGVIGAGAAGSVAAAGAAAGGIGAGALAGASAALAAIPVWGWAALAVLAIAGASSGGGGAPKVNVNSRILADAYGITDRPIDNGSTQYAGGQETLTRAVYDQAIQDFVRSIAPNTSLELTLAGHLNMKGRSSNQKLAEVIEGGEQIYRDRRETGKGMDDFNAYVQDQVPRMRLAILTEAMKDAGGDFKAVADIVISPLRDLTSVIADMPRDKVDASVLAMINMLSVFDQFERQVGGDIDMNTLVDYASRNKKTVKGADGRETEETLLQSVDRIMGATAALANVFNKLGDTLVEKFGAEDIFNLADAFVKLFGTTEELTKSLDAYVANYYTETEKSRMAWDQIGKSFAALNLSTPKTREEFRRLVEAQDLSTAAGQAAFKGLMDIQGAFAQLTQTMGAAAEAERAYNEARRAEARQMASDLLGDLQSSYDSLLNTARTERQKAGGYVGNLGYSAGEYDSIANFIEYTNEASDALEKIATSEFADRLTGYTDQIEALITRVQQMSFEKLREVRLTAGDFSGAVAAQIATMPAVTFDQFMTPIARPARDDFATREAWLDNLATWNARGGYTQQGQFNAGAFNLALERQQLQAQLSVISQASANALRYQNVNIPQRLFPSLELQQSIRQEVAASVGLGADSPLTRALYSAIDAAADRAAERQYTVSGQGLAGVYKAQAEYRNVASQEYINGRLYVGRDAIEYAKAIRSLNDGLRSGTLDAETFASGVEKIAILFGDASNFDLAAAYGPAGESARNLFATASGSVNYYFSQLGDIVAETAAAAEKAATPLSEANQAIGLLNSMATVFSGSANGMAEGISGMVAAGQALLSMGEQDTTGLLSQGYAAMQAAEAEGSNFRSAALVGTAAKIASQLLTTSDAKRAAEALKDKESFAGSSAAELRNKSLLLDGLQAFDNQAFKVVFDRISDALAKGTITEAQYIDMLGESFRVVTGEAEDTADAFAAVREAAKSLADSLMVDDTLSSLNSPNMLQEAKRQYEAAIEKAKGGDVSDLDGTSRRYLELASDWSATSADYDMKFAQVIADVRQIEKTPKATTTTDDVVAALDELRLDLQTMGATTASNQSKLQRLLEALTDAGDALNVKVVP